MLSRVVRHGGEENEECLNALVPLVFFQECIELCFLCLRDWIDKIVSFPQSFLLIQCGESEGLLSFPLCLKEIEILSLGECIEGCLVCRDE